MLSDLWEELRDYVKLDVTTALDQSASDKEPTLVVGFTITNRSSNSGSPPSVVFESITITVVGPSRRKEYDLGSVHPSQSAHCQHRVPLKEWPDMRYALDWKVSWEALLSQHQESAPPGSAHLPPSFLVRACQLASVRRWEVDVLRAIPVPSPATTLDEIQLLANRLGEERSEVQATRNRLERFDELVDTRANREAVSDYRRKRACPINPLPGW